MIPTLLDYVAVVCYYIALNFISGSVYQILRGGTVLTTFLFSYTCLNIRPTRSRIAGCLLVLLGLVIVGLVNFFMSSGSSEQK
jgi:drug/metabolite transporter (DMT)-like permease